MSEETPLRRLYRLHREIDRVSRHLERLPRKIAAARQLLDQSDQAYHQIKERLHRAERLAKEKQEHLKAREARVDELRRRLNECSSNKEFQALQQQIRADDQATSVLTDEIVELLDRIEELQGTLEAARKERAEAEGQLASVTEEAEGQMAAYRQELAGLQEQVAEAAGQLSADIRTEYQRIVELRGSEGLALVEGSSCNVCRRALTLETIHQVSQGKAVACTSCGAILVGIDA